MNSEKKEKDVDQWRPIWFISIKAVMHRAIGQGSLYIRHGKIFYKPPAYESVWIEPLDYNTKLDKWAGVGIRATYFYDKQEAEAAFDQLDLKQLVKEFNALDLEPRSLPYVRRSKALRRRDDVV